MSDIKERVTRIQKDFIYTQIASLNKDVDVGWGNIQSEVWHCGKNGSSSYAFDICIMPMGISVCGDIGELTFNVYGRDIDFLAGKDIGYYIHNKLSENSKEKQFCETKFYSYVVDQLLSDIEYKEFTNDGEYEKFEKLVEDENFADFFEKCQTMYFDCDVSNKEYDYLRELDYFINEIKSVYDDRSAHELLYKTDFISFDDSWEYDFTEMSDSLWFKLNMINHAAKKIVGIKEGKNIKGEKNVTQIIR